MTADEAVTRIESRVIRRVGVAYTEEIATIKARLVYFDEVTTNLLAGSYKDAETIERLKGHVKNLSMIPEGLTLVGEWNVNGKKFRAGASISTHQLEGATDALLEDIAIRVLKELKHQLKKESV